MNRLPALPPLPNTRTFHFPTPATPPAATPLSTPAHRHVAQYSSSPTPSQSDPFAFSGAAQPDGVGGFIPQHSEPQVQSTEPSTHQANSAAAGSDTSLVLSSHDSGWSAPSDNPSSSHATNSVASNAVLPSIFIDNLSNDLGLFDDQTAQMHFFADLGSVRPALTPADLATRLYMLGAIFALGAEQKRAAAVAAKSVQNLPALFTDLKIRLENTFVFTQQQRDNIRAIAQDLIYQPKRTVFKTMFTDVEVILEKDQEKLALKNVYGNPWRTKQLSTLVKVTCSSVRNHFRRDIVESIAEAGKKKSSLQDFTISKPSN